MGEPIKKVPLRCDKGEYLDTDDKGEPVCLLDMGPLELMGEGTCDEECFASVPSGLVPFRGERAAQDQFKPVSPEKMGETDKTADAITRIAEYECTRSHYTKIPVTIRFIPNEAPEKTEDRFEKAAEIELRGMKFRKEDAKCKSLSFARFLPTAGDVLKTKKTESTKPNSFNPLTAYGDSMRDCQKAIGSYILCKPQP